ncbi:PREDICTED: leucine-rich repeat-containing protein 75A [Nanorana parkeri]|uniref:leucine-rich repeat-containing protein 75A n=1 Tax=Nanorana parkeri TaxID=125878 RepID=UPI000854199D|nr:PREDICTED: leucine-rich repeat-containing protein 75A [Nanorana parkeri]
MGTKQTKVCQASSAGGESPQHPPGSRRSTPARDRGDFWSSFGVKSGDKLGKNVSGGLAPYHRRNKMIQDMMQLLRQGRQEEATEVLRHLRQDLGMESTSLDDVLYRYASFRNLVDPITHDLIISLARYVHCPKPEGDSLGAMEKVCRQLTYHLSPHSQWKRQGIVKRKPQACLKAILAGKPNEGTLDLSGIPFTMKDMERVILYLQHNSEDIENVELCFSELTDEMFVHLMPVLSALPHLTTLALNGNRLTKAILREITEALKDSKKFPCMTWIDLGNNVDIFSLPQPFLVSLKKRCPKQGSLPTILEFGEGQLSDLENQDTSTENKDEQVISSSDDNIIQPES